MIILIWANSKIVIADEYDTILSLRYEYVLAICRIYMLRLYDCRIVDTFP